MTLVRYAASHIHHMHKALAQMNLQLHQVVADIKVPPVRIIKVSVPGTTRRSRRVPVAPE